MKVIQKIETGGEADPYSAKGRSGEYGAYQFMPSTWSIYSYAYFGELLKMTPENQDSVAYLKIKKLVDRGYTPEQIASIWNSGSSRWQGKKGRNKWGAIYNVPRYVDKFQKYYYGSQI